MRSLSLFVFFFICFSLAGGEEVLVDQCIHAAFKDYCSTISTSDDCLHLNSTFTVAGEATTVSTDLSSIVGGGEASLFCETTSDGCSACWTVDQVDVTGDNIQSCYKLVVLCEEFFTFRITADLGCASATNCESNQCPNSCNGNGNCSEAGFCECNDNYFGEDCSIEINDGCFAASEPEIAFCLDVEATECGIIDIMVEEYESQNVWEVRYASILQLSNSMTYDTTVHGNNEECPLHLFLTDVNSENNLFFACVQASSPCLGETSFHIECITIPIEEACETCFFSIHDESMPPESGDLSLQEDEFVYYTLRKDNIDPMADIIVAMDLQEGSLALRERRGCRPTVTEFESFAEMVRPGYLNWEVLNECSTALSSTMQLENLYYFAFQCTDPAGCLFSFSFAAHSMQTLSLRQEIHKPLWERTGYQYFRYYSNANPIQFTLTITNPLETQVAGSLYVNKGDCASKYNFLAGEANLESQSELDGQMVSVFVLSVDPNEYALVGVPMSLTVYTSAACDHQQQCGFWQISVSYPEESASLPVTSYPDQTSGTALPYHTDSYNTAAYTSDPSTFSTLPVYDTDDLTNSLPTTDDSTYFIVTTDYSTDSAAYTTDLSTISSTLTMYTTDDSTDSVFTTDDSTDSVFTTDDSTDSVFTTDDSTNSMMYTTDDSTDSSPIVMESFPSDSSNGSSGDSSDDSSKRSSDNSSNGSSDNSSNESSDNGQQTLWIALGSTAGGLLLLCIIITIVGCVGVVVYKRKSKSRYQLGFDDDGLLLGDSDFEL